MNIESYILEYLKKFGQVSVPAFGVFGLKNTKAQIDESSKTFLPPAKEITFEANYQDDNSSFLQYLVSVENLGFIECRMKVSELVEYWKNTLDQKLELNVEEIGFFRKEDNQIKFEGNRIEVDTPDYYGLEKISIEKVSSISDLSKTEYRINNWILWLFLCLIPVAGILFLGFTQKERFFGKKSFDEVTIKNSTHRIKKENDSAHVQTTITIDTLKQDSISNGVQTSK